MKPSLNPVSKTFEVQVKRALVDLYDPVALSRHPLAHLCPPPYLAKAGGHLGRALQLALEEAIEQVRPSEVASRSPRQQRRYNVLRYRFLEGLEMKEVALRLAVSEREFRRVQREAIQSASSFLHELVYPQYLLMGPEPIPCLRAFVGREAELARHRQELKLEHFTAIIGLAGMGKTSLGAELAHEWKKKAPVIWITLRQGRNDYLEAVLEALAMSLAALGQDEYWHFLRANAPGVSSLPQEARLRYLFNVLEQRNYLLCLDDIHLAAQNEALSAFCTELVQRARSGRYAVLVMGRESPVFAAGQLFVPLKGLSQAGARQLLLAAKLPTLSEETFVELYHMTQGVPLFLRWLVTWFHTRPAGGSEEEIARFIHQVGSEPEVQRYLLKEVEGSLSIMEQRFLSCISIFRTPLDVNEKPVSEFLNAFGIQETGATMVSLEGKQVVLCLEGGVMDVHPLIREHFYRRLLDQPAQKAEMHRLAAKYYELDKGDFLEAAYHYFEAGDYPGCARLLSERVWDLIDAGQAEGTLNQLGRLKAHQVADQGLWQQATLALGEVSEIRGDYVRALACYREALEIGGAEERLADIDMRIGRVQTRQSAFDAALASLEAGMALLSHKSETVEMARLCSRAAETLQAKGDYERALELGLRGAMILEKRGADQELGKAYRTLGLIHQHLGNLPAALDYCQKALRLQEKIGHTQDLAYAHRELSRAYFLVEDFAQAKEQSDQALALCRRIGDVAGVAANLNNLGAVCVAQDNYAEAIELFRQSLVLEQKIGDAQRTVNVSSNLGVLYYYRGDYKQAKGHLEKARRLSQQIGYRHGIALALLNLGAVYFCLGEWEHALVADQASLALWEEVKSVHWMALCHTSLGELCHTDGRDEQALYHLREAERLLLESDNRAYLAEVYHVLADTYLSSGDAQQALAYADAALQRALETGRKVDQGKACRVLGEVWSARGDGAKAEEFFGQSIALLEAIGVLFDLGRAYRSYGLFLHRVGREGKPDLERAREIFERLGASRELEKTRAML